MLTATELQAVRAFLDECIDDADSEIIHQIRRNSSTDRGREALLSELDVLERVRERLNVRVDNYIERNTRAI